MWINKIASTLKSIPALVLWIYHSISIVYDCTFGLPHAISLTSYLPTYLPTFLPSYLCGSPYPRNLLERPGPAFLTFAKPSPGIPAVGKRHFSVWQSWRFFRSKRMWFATAPRSLKRVKGLKGKSGLCHICCKSERNNLYLSKWIYYLFINIYIYIHILYIYIYMLYIDIDIVPQGIFPTVSNGPGGWAHLDLGRNALCHQVLAGKSPNFVPWFSHSKISIESGNFLACHVWGYPYCNNLCPQLEEFPKCVPQGPSRRCCHQCMWKSCPMAAGSEIAFKDGFLALLQLHAADLMSPSSDDFP